MANYDFSRTGPHSTRRQFLTGVAAAGAMMVGSSGFPNVARAQTTDAKRGGHFRIGIGSGSSTDSLDPALYHDTFMMSLGRSLHGYLADINAEGELVGELAVQWEPSSDAKTWNFKLRKDVVFHNGKTLDADDVVASINHHRGDQSQSGAKGIVDAIEDIRADGPHIVVIKLKEGNADFPFMMEDYTLAILPQKDGKVDVSGVGCGGYQLDGIDFGVKAIAKRFENYWKPNSAWFDSVETLAIHDTVARTNALTTGQIHAMDRCDLKTVRLLERDRRVEIASVAGTQHYTLPMLVDVAPFDNVDVRLALKCSIDRQQLLDTVLYGHGQLGNDHPIAPGTRDFAVDLPQRQYDPDKAKFHLSKAGLSSLSVDLSASDAAFAGAVDSAVIYQQNAQKSGISINVVREPADGYWENVWLKKPWCLSYWGGRPTADWMFSQFYAAGVSLNETRWKNPRFNKLLVAARPELDVKKRAEMYTEMQAICRDDGGSVIPLFANYVNAVSRKIGHGKIGSSRDLDGFRCAERWWFAT
ncbi:peptide/nickel transport system substrate-binding protein [Mesorhizobium robiniae]|uniref:Peptide/nickel transport system substrate-binding protein n=1 Tax=Mesorhizobium robiniae TaxID=559315 RepID=A0ABV2GZ58_9HYPH|nr:ABC transporter substrate-binding protein [Mesorhizobium sp. ZC-5]MCV3243948.1 ABC transporter substrate-binding protein [Mesorhizobium sp. ZC-5]